MKEKTKPKEVKLLQPKIDIVFQSLFNAKNKEITKSFVEALLEEKIDSMIINNEKEITRDKSIDKLGILDLELDINNKEKVDVEVQLLKNDEFVHRLLFYWSRIYSKQIHRGDEYTKARRVVIIAITDFEIDITKELKRMETIWNIREKQNPEKVLTDLLEIRIINLKRIREAYQKDKDSKKNQWVMFLEDPNSREVQEIMEKNEDVKKAVVTVREMSEDEKMERLAELRQKAIMDEKALYNTGIREGKELGRAEGEKIGREAGEKVGRETGEKIGREVGEKIGEQKNKIEVIKRMLNEKFDNDTIKKIANATDKEIEEARAIK